MNKYKGKFDYCNELAEKLDLQLSFDYTLNKDSMVRVFKKSGGSWLIGIDYLIIFLCGYTFAKEE